MKPMKLFYSPLTGNVYASQEYKEVDGGYLITGEKHDVTDDFDAISEQKLCGHCAWSKENER